MTHKPIRIVLASYFEPDYHGPGRKIGISPQKPNSAVDCDFVFHDLSPGKDEYFQYHKEKKIDIKSASDNFNNHINFKLNNFLEEVKKAAENEGISVFEVLPFQDGDTLLSWERKGNLTYRDKVALVLRELGYEVIEN